MCILIAVGACVLFGFIVDWIEDPEKVKNFENYMQDDNDSELKPSAVKMPQKTPCPICKGSEVAEIIYGLQTLTPKLQKAVDRKKIILGGCMIYNGAPRWYCLKCKKDYGSISL